MSAIFLLATHVTNLTFFCDDVQTLTSGISGFHEVKSRNVQPQRRKLTTQQIRDVCVGRCNIYLCNLFFVLFFFPLPLCCIMFPTHDFLRSMTHFPPISDKSDFHFVSGLLWLSWERASCLFPHFSVWRNEHTQVNVTSTSCCNWRFITFVKRGIIFFFWDGVSLKSLLPMILNSELLNVTF